ncbi:putative bud/polarization protein [Suhomyces tanzawaensis NRRL Y-17324]|uniref:Putative bud/polarization protein n=1 Tax=Suhomyces tanzawaensis NRRL Y-17324 TaxID=984487 RepID=A0A1E4SMX9_9ASCO|nr:putative bud/polarization protein [Suhomyces tanzawaensis NRRL Y-17324]ODV80777.1 putative bud/polarization protein [Suhomyces tanzawaensis NRRL Y-17324]
MSVEDVQDYNKEVANNANNHSVPVDGSKNEEKIQPEKVSVRNSSTFSWTNVGFWNSSSTLDKLHQLEIIKAIESYVTDHFYGDWYWNCSIMVGTCFFSWLIARIGGGILSLGFILLFTSSVYRTEFRRFNRNIRDDMTRINASNRLENELETMEWLNSFMDKFWVIYMPALSETVMFQTNEILKDQAPGFGIEALSLDEFTLGSKAPRVDSIKSYTKKGHDHIEMDWAFSFTPNDTDDMTKNEIKKKINPKVALGVTVGKAFITKSLPILVEDMSFTGRMNIKLKLTQNFPHVKMVSVQFLEAPTIDYALKPVGGDTFGIDIMSFIPGLSKFVNGLIHSNLRPMLYAPNSLDIDVEDIMAQQSNDSIGVVAVGINRLSHLKIGNPTPKNSLNPYVELKISNNAEVEEKTKVKKLVNDPVYMETIYLLVNNLDGNHLSLNVFNFLKDKADDQLIGNIDVPLVDLYQKPIQKNVVKSLTEGGRTVGKIDYDLRWFPQMEPMVLEDGTKEPVTDAEVGILKINLHEARDLDISQSVIGLLNPYAEILVNYKGVKTCRQLRQINEPVWDQSFESLVTSQSKTRVQIIVKDAVDDQVVGKVDANIQDLIFESNRGQQWIKGDQVKPDVPPARFRISATWKSLAMTDDSVVKSYPDASIGGLRLHLRQAVGLKNLESVGKIDPYARILLHGKVRGRTPTFANTLDPAFNSVSFLPVANEHQHFLVEFMDEEDEKDRTLGSAAISVNDFLKKNDEGYYLAYDGSEELIEQPILLNGQPHGKLTYSVSFVPTIPVFTHHQIENKKEYEEIEAQKQAEDAARQAEEEKLYKEKPDEYQWLETNEDIVPSPPKVTMPLEKAIRYRTGILNVHLLSGSFDKPDLYVHTLFDDHSYPSGVSPRAEGRHLLVSSSGEGFIRDLPNSKLIIRLAKRVDVNREKDVIAEKIFDTLDCLKRGFAKPITLRINDKNSVQVRFEFIPSAFKLAPLDTILDVGHMKLDILSAENLKSVDSNGKSDPLVVVKLDGVEIYKTDKKRKTLDPIWNEAVDFPLISRSRQVVLVEVYDWDLTHDDELLGRANLDLSTIEPHNSTQFQVNLDTQGTVNLRATFKPEYIRPQLHSASGLPIDLSAVSGVPLKVVGGAAGVATNVVGSGIGLATDGVTKGGSFLKGLGRRKKKEDKKELDPNSIEANAEEAPTAAKQAQSDDEEDEDVATNSKNVAGVPNIHAENLPAPQRPHMTHSRTASMATEDSYAASIHGPGTIPGRISVVSAQGFSNSNLEVKISLKTSTKDKELYKTRATKVDKETGLYRWNESTPFKSASSGELHFYVREHHTFGKTVNLGHTVLPLVEVLNKAENIVLNAGEGELTVNIRYLST